MACFVVAVVPDSIAVVVCRSSTSGRCELVRNWQISLCCFVLDVLFIAADCWLIIYILVFFFFVAQTYFPSSGHTSRGHRVCRHSLPPPPVIAFIFLAYGVRHPLIVDFSSSAANSRSRAFRKSISAQDEKLYEYAFGGIRTHEADLYQARGYNLIRHRGSKWCRAGRPGGLVGLHSNTTIILLLILTSVGRWVK